MLSCIIIEDQAPAQRVLKKYITDLGKLNLIGTFADALSALEFLKKNDVNLIFLDIHLPKISGIEFLKIMPNDCKVILTTAFQDYALQGYELDVVDYLLKPFSFNRFVKAYTKVATQLENLKTDKDFIFIKLGHDFVKVEISGIYYLKADGDYCYIFTKEKRFHTSHTLKYWVDKLPKEFFAQVHKSYAVYVPSIVKITGSNIIFESEQIPIGRSFKEGFYAKYL